MIGLTLLKALHVLCAVLWVGGTFFAILVLRPSLVALEPSRRLALHAGVFRRFFLVVWHAMPLVILTGYGMAFGYYGGMGALSWTVHLMSLLGFAMAGVFLVIFFGPYRRFRLGQTDEVKAAAAESIRKLVTINLVLGVAAVVLGVMGGVAGR